MVYGEHGEHCIADSDELYIANMEKVSQLPVTNR